MSRSQLLVAILLAAYFYLGLPATATLFYELYHVIGIGALYWAYSGFKAAGYFLGAYEYRVPVCLASAAVIVLVPVWVKKLFSTERTGQTNEERL
ncbi:hypothetical protein [Candidatus Marimicrobium litorale]|uniref:Uncharacterized protein n=1 Tax=Candidatus Marimicrobium litorale TaxID=2518991 RepID=A0ABT3T3P9_9GAMM|nr:hypothetical protein [Candidatus Marimicrobium litorale]MCX2976456.1 hypothetical protein [Candidatus Marimicrobium litorale]